MHTHAPENDTHKHTHSHTHSHTRMHALDLSSCLALSFPKWLHAWSAGRAQPSQPVPAAGLRQRQQQHLDLGPAQRKQAHLEAGGSTNFPRRKGEEKPFSLQTQQHPNFQISLVWLCSPSRLPPATPSLLLPPLSSSPRSLAPSHTHGKCRCCGLHGERARPRPPPDRPALPLADTMASEICYSTKYYDDTHEYR